MDMRIDGYRQATSRLIMDGQREAAEGLTPAETAPTRRAGGHCLGSLLRGLAQMGRRRGRECPAPVSGSLGMAGMAEDRSDPVSAVAFRV
jgi:hypothetical protein